MELIFNLDTKIPPGTDKSKYAKYGQDMPIHKSGKYLLIRDGYRIQVPNKNYETGIIFLFPGDMLIDYKNKETIIMVINNDS